VAGGFPEIRIQSTEEVGSILFPTPPQVVCHPLQRGQFVGQGGNDSEFVQQSGEVHRNTLSFFLLKLFLHGKEALSDIFFYSKRIVSLQPAGKYIPAFDRTSVLVGTLPMTNGQLFRLLVAPPIIKEFSAI
jgi:hypothetical protein